jgi:hypothetical protein
LSTSVYVYYKVDPERLAELRRAIDQLFLAVERDGGIRGHWQRRRDDPTTYMEVYPQVDDASSFEALLASECERLGIARLLAPGSVRRVETFITAD